MKKKPYKCFIILIYRLTHIKQCKAVSVLNFTTTKILSNTLVSVCNLDLDVTIRFSKRLYIEAFIILLTKKLIHQDVNFARSSQPSHLPMMHRIFLALCLTDPIFTKRAPFCALL